MKHKIALLTVFSLLYLSTFSLNAQNHEPIPHEPELERTSRIIRTETGESFKLEGLFNVDTGAPVMVRGGFADVQFSGDFNRESFGDFIDAHRDRFRISSKDLEIIHAGEVQGKGYFTAVQLIDHRPVSSTRVLLRIGEKGSVILWGSDIVDQDKITWQAGISESDAADALARSADLNEFKVISVQEIWQRVGKGAEPAFRIKIQGESLLDRFEGLVMVEDGRVISISREIFEASMSGTVDAVVYPRNLNDEAEIRPIANQIVQLSDEINVLTDSAGYYEIGELDDGDYTLDMIAASRYFILQSVDLDFMGPPPGDVYDPYIVSLDGNTNEPLDFTWDPADGYLRNAAIHVFYHANLVRSYWFDMDPELEIVNSTVHIYTDQGEGMMANNAFYMPAMPEQNVPHLIYFGRGEGQFNNFGLLADIIYHEYTHGVTAQLIDRVQEGEIGAIHEGCSDYYAATILDSPDMGIGIFAEYPDSVMRTIDNDLQFPDDMGEDSHHSGLIIGGAFWDMREAIGAELADEYIHFARYGSPRRFEAYLEEILILDDDNEDLNDGTPHWNDILAAFNAHGIGEDWVSVRDEPVETALLPQAPFLDSVYPNPFNPSTSICFFLPRSERVQLLLTDACGRELAHLIDSELVKGSYHVPVNMADAASGTYFVRLETSGGVQSKQIILCR